MKKNGVIGMRIENVWRRIGCLMLCIVFLLQMEPMEVCASEYWPDGPATESPSVILMELSTGMVLYEKNSREAHFPASITKIMTTLVALENSDLNEIVTFSDRSIDETIGSGIARDYGEQMTMEQCLYGVMLSSANECAFAVAEHVGGTMEKFVEMMNEKAKELGCVNTNFANPHGLHEENHYTSAYDMALIAKAAYENETFRIITGTPRYTIPPTNKHKEQTDLQNHNEMLYPFRTGKYVYENCTGGKTGYTEAANSTLVTYAEKDGMSLVCVVMNVQSPAQWSDSKNLFEYAYGNFQLFRVADYETRYDSSIEEKASPLNNNGSFVEIDENAKVILPKTAEFLDTTTDITYHQSDNNAIGIITYTYAGREVGKADITKSGVVVQGFVFDNQKEDGIKDKKEIAIVQIRPITIIIALSGLVVFIILIILGKRFVDNYYIIRHNMEVRKMRRQQPGRDKSRRKRHRRYRR